MYRGEIKSAEAGEFEIYPNRVLHYASYLQSRTWLLALFFLILAGIVSGVLSVIMQLGVIYLLKG
jgi:hypothetical protein